MFPSGCNLPGTMGKQLSVVRLDVSAIEYLLIFDSNGTLTDGLWPSTKMPETHNFDCFPFGSIFVFSEFFPALISI